MCEKCQWMARHRQRKCKWGLRSLLHLAPLFEHYHEPGSSWMQMENTKSYLSLLSVKWPVLLPPPLPSLPSRSPLPTSPRICLLPLLSSSSFLFLYSHLFSSSLSVSLLVSFIPSFLVSSFVPILHHTIFSLFSLISSPLCLGPLFYHLPYSPLSPLSSPLLFFLLMSNFSSPLLSWVFDSFYKHQLKAPVTGCC